ncbi:hypothetical protein Afil01_32810 [Actinorhabdospora filicis]|uniref:Uncharacterized protein n=1 Tax=Actinorhabdospora filicis TaxID=1785913 RepID=A0A9W6SME5_9ACTN|nr:hypothetical protein Afil01_32810 [Actinorhabdospora filicis]
MVWLGLFPLLLLAENLIGPLLGGLPGPLRLALVSAVLVLAMTYLVVPALQRILHNWLTTGVNK